MELYFSGSATGAVDRHGRLALPTFVRSVLARSPSGGGLFFGRHETDACVVGYDRSRIQQLAADLERKRLLDEAQGVAPATHHARCRRLFGLATEAPFDDRGRVHFPAHERSRLGIVEKALFVGIGVAFEVWGLEQACDAEADSVAEIARYHMTDANP